MKNNTLILFTFTAVALFTMSYSFYNEKPTKDKRTFKEKMIDRWDNVKSSMPWWIKNPILYRQANMNAVAEFLIYADLIGNSQHPKEALFKKFATSVYPILIQLDPPPILGNALTVTQYSPQAKKFWQSFFDTVRIKSTVTPKIQEKKYAHYAKILNDYRFFYRYKKKPTRSEKNKLIHLGWSLEQAYSYLPTPQ